MSSAGCQYRQLELLAAQWLWNLISVIKSGALDPVIRVNCPQQSWGCVQKLRKLSQSVPLRFGVQVYKSDIISQQSGHICNPNTGSRRRGQIMISGTPSAMQQVPGQSGLHEILFLKKTKQPRNNQINNKKSKQKQISLNNSYQKQPECIEGSCCI